MCRSSGHVGVGLFVSFYILTTFWTGVPAKAARGNFLEAINVTLNVLEKHYMDRDLTRTGNSILMISPSTGVIEVIYRVESRVLIFLGSPFFHHVSHD